jgi:hypothetical protein
MDSPCMVFFWSVNMSELSQTCNMSFKSIMVVQIQAMHGKAEVDVLKMKGGAVALSLCELGVFARLAKIEEGKDAEVFDGIGEGRVLGKRSMVRSSCMMVALMGQQAVRTWGQTSCSL